MMKQGEKYAATIDKSVKTASSRLPWWAVEASYAAGAWAFLIAMVHFYWASGGSAWLAAAPLLQGQRIPQPSPLWFRVASSGIGGVCLVACLVALALIRPWGRQIPRLVLLSVSWGACVVLLFEANLATFGGLAFDIMSYLGQIGKPLDGGGFLMRGVAELGGVLWFVTALFAQAASLARASPVAGQTLRHHRYGYA